MSLINASHDSLPYIDKPVTDAEKASINSLIAAELPSDHLTTLHPSIPQLPEPSFGPLITAELERISSQKPMEGGVDVSRYENQDPPSEFSSTEEAGEILKAAYASSTHLSNRVTNLTLLSQFGSNGWLIGNSQLEAVLASLERELVAVKEETEVVNRERKRRQVEVQDEMERLNRRFKEGVGKVLEVEVANEMIFRETLSKRRADASGN